MVECKGKLSKKGIVACFSVVVMNTDQKQLGGVMWLEIRGHYYQEKARHEPKAGT